MTWRDLSFLVCAVQHRLQQQQLWEHSSMLVALTLMLSGQALVPQLMRCCCLNGKFNTPSFLPFCCASTSPMFHSVLQQTQASGSGAS
ncbi:hypothetical protein COO60DRAFT_1474287 [Scenedesmus sp. NREL 46B-D3]|nr:hypothetical protein COO60DRAFT_1474287 [Scenedesmus sp. NREL 46B-D3]